MKKILMTLMLAIVSGGWITSKAENLRLPSLCDEWNMLVEPFSCDGPYCYLHTTIFRLTTDTIIDANRYVKLGTQTTYSGALREGANHDIYYIPAGSTHEYLLYAFNAQVGDRLTNLWIGGVANECPNGYSGTVQSISDGTPRIFTLDIDPVEDGIIPLQSKWIEGVGFTDNPTGPQFYLHSAVDYGVETILCAYKEDEQVYASGLSKRYGCQFDGIPSAKPFYLCDEWNILEVSDVTSGSETYSTHKHRLTQDTLIAYQSYYPFLRYVRLEEDGQYSGAIREGGNREIYYIPAGSTHEYLLYAFNAHEGDQLRNLWIGGNASDYPNGWTMTVVDIQETTPRTFVLSTGYTHTEDGIENDPLYTIWIEGVGLLEGPVGAKRCVGCVDSRAHGVLCAYKNGEQVYTSEMGEKYGCEYNYDPSQPMFPSDTKWHYVYTEMYGGPDFKPRYFSVSPIDTVINNTHYQQINGILFRSDATKVWCVIDSMDTRIERLVYDFDLQVGDSIRKLCYGYDGYWTEEPYCEESRYAKVTNVEYIQLGDGRMARHLSYDNRPDDIEHIGCVDGIFAPLNFPVSTCGCGDYFQCCTRGDVLLYEVESGACDTFFIKEQPTDTIPLYARDDSGSSTVDPVDPNQVVVTLKGDELTIRESSGDEINFMLTNTSVASSAARAPKIDDAQSFRNEVSVQLTEDGNYQLILTNPNWDYKIYGTFRYAHQGLGRVNDESSATKILRDGHVLIERNGRVYSLTGMEIK